jgi:hypothetical protein
LKGGNVVIVAPDGATPIVSSETICVVAHWGKKYGW